MPATARTCSTWSATSATVATGGGSIERAPGRRGHVLLPVAAIEPVGVHLGQHRVVPGLARGRHELRHERHHADAAVGRQLGQHVVGHVAHVVDDAARGRVAEDDRRRGHRERVAHRADGDVRQVDHHAEPVHLSDHRPSEVVEPAEDGRIGGRVGPRHVVVVGQRQVPHAEREQGAQHGERAVDRMAALGAQQRCDQPVGSGAARCRQPSWPARAGRGSARPSGARSRSARGSR